MKKFTIIVLFLLLALLSACREETVENELYFNIENNHKIYQNVGDTDLNLEGITATNKAGDDLTSSITASSYSLQQAGSFEVLLEARDNDGTIASVTVIVIVSRIDCTQTPLDPFCIIDVTDVNFKNVDSSSSTFYPGETSFITWEVLPLNASNKKVVITSSNPEFVSIDSSGRLEALAIGESIITIQTEDGAFEVSHKITVMEKTCDMDPTQDKCFIDILDDDSRLVTYNDPNGSNTDYSQVYPNHDLYYEIYVRSFANSDSDSIGDFTGIEESIPYLRSMGVSALWLMPIMQSRSDHGYETDDYYAVDDEYGSMDDFKALLDAAHEEDMTIIIDLVLNHMGAQNDIFQDVLRNGVSSDYYDWFVWADADDSRIDDVKYDGGPIWYTPRGRDWLKKSNDFSIHPSLYNQYYYALFSDWMPDLNLENPDVIAYLYDVALYWLDDVGVDGFRLDATSHFYHNDEYNINNAHQMNALFLENFKNHVSEHHPDVYIVAEAWEDYNTYARYFASGVSMFDFQAMYYMKDSLQGSFASLGDKLDSLYNLYDNYDPDFIDAPFLSNHDIDRISTILSDDELHLSAELLLTLPGNPFIYYGDEIGLKGTRSNMVWGNYYSGLYPSFVDSTVDSVSLQMIDSDSLLSTYKEIGSLRENSLALRYGDFIPYRSTGLDGYYRIFDENDDQELLLVLFNFDDSIVRAIPSEFNEYEIIYASKDTNLGGISQNSMMIIRVPFVSADNLD